MSQIIVNYSITAVTPIINGVIVYFVLNSPDTNNPQEYYSQYVPTLILEQGVTQSMSAEQRSTQVNNTFLTLTKPIFEDFAIRAKVGEKSIHAANDMGYNSGSLNLDVHPILGSNGQIVI